MHTDKYDNLVGKNDNVSKIVIATCATNGNPY